MTLRPRALLVRHCASTGQAPDAPLTALGYEQAERLADRLVALGAGRIVSSPWRRARESITPFALRTAAPVAFDDRLIERALGGGDLAEWRSAVERSFAALDLVLPGGESSRAAAERGRAALDDALGTGLPVLVTHGQLLSLILRSIDARVGFADWAALSNPDLFVVESVPGSGLRFWREWRDA